MKTSATSSERDLLNGFQEIADALGITKRQAKHRAKIGALPIFRMGRSVCARRSTINQHFSAQEAAAAAAVLTA